MNGNLVEMNKITHVAWLNARCIGVVRVETQYDYPKFYIKAITTSELYYCFTRNETNDAINVAHWGHILKDTIGEAIMKEYGRKLEITYR